MIDHRHQKSKDPGEAEKSGQRNSYLQQIDLTLVLCFVGNRVLASLL